MISPTVPFYTRKQPSVPAACRAVRDAELVRLFLGGDESAFAEIVDHHRGPLFAVALSYLRNAADAEEITQDTFVRAYRSLAKFRGDSSLATWLHRIVSNLAKNRYWYFFRRCRHLTSSLDVPLGEDGSGTPLDFFSSDEPTPAQASCMREFSGLAEQSLIRLEPYHQNILYLRNVAHLSYREIAANLGIKEGTVKSRLARARERLRTLVWSACPDLDSEVEIAAWFDAERPNVQPKRQRA